MNRDKLIRKWPMSGFQNVQTRVRVRALVKFRARVRARVTFGTK